MATITLTPTTATTPNIGGDSAVTSATATGHNETDCVAENESSQDDRSCRWSGFPAGPPGRLSATLKITHTSSGVLSGGTAANSFKLDYSLNGGGAWNSAVSRTNYTASIGPTVFSVALAAGQDLTAVQVRDRGTTITNQLGDTATATFEISAIGIEVVTVDAGVIWMG